MRSDILIDGLRKDDIEITHVWVRFGGARQALQMKYSEHPFSLNYHFKFWGNLLPRIVFENINVFWVLLKKRSTIKKSNFLFLSDYSNYIVFTVKIFAFFYQKPIIFDAHGSLYYQRIIGTEDYPKNSIYAKVIFAIDKLCALLVEKYITLSTSYVEKLSTDFHIQKERFIPIYLGFDPVKDRKRYHNDGNRNIDILHLSSHQIFHGIPKAIELISHIVGKKQRLRTLCTGSLPYQDIIQNLRLEKNIESRRLDHKEKLEYIEKTKLIFGPMGESELNKIDFSTKMCEALAFGKVLVAQDTPSARELLQDGVNAVLIDIHDLEGSTQKIIEVLDDNAKRTAMEKEALKTYEKYLRPEIVVQELAEYIKNYF